MVTAARAPATTHRVVVELSSGGTTTYTKVLGSVSNLVKAFAGDKTVVEIVCRDSGIDLLLSGTGALRDRMSKLHSQGVVFAACRNTLRARHIDRKRLVPFAVVVDAGVAEIVRKEEDGWSYLKG